MKLLLIWQTIENQGELDRTISSTSPELNTIKHNVKMYQMYFRDINTLITLKRQNSV